MTEQKKYGMQQYENADLPHNAEAEQMLLGAIMHDNSILEQVDDFMLAEHFYSPVHQRIYKRMSDLIQSGQIANPITIVPILLQEIPNIREYVIDLSTMIVSSSVAQTYAKMIYDLYIKRQLIGIGKNILDKCYDSSLDMEARDHIEEAEKSLFDLSLKGHTQDQQDISFGAVMKNVYSMADSAFKQGGNIIGVTTGLRDVDKTLGGMHPSDLIVVAGRPSMGKTALGMNIAFNAAKAYANKIHGGVKVAFFSLEMSREQIGMRLIGQESQVPSDQIRRGAISTTQLNSLAKQMEILKTLPLFIDDTPSLSITAMNARIRRWVRQEKIGLVVIDYLQLITVNGRSESRLQELSVITRSLKAIAKTYNIPVIAISQLSRAVEMREDKHPQLSDLRESGDIEQAADVVCLLKRDAYYVARKKPADDSIKMDLWQQEMKKVHGKATLIIAKQRHGPIKNITLSFNEMLTKFGDYDGVVDDE